jgi:hypothetical protein
MDQKCFLRTFAQQEFSSQTFHRSKREKRTLDADMPVRGTRWNEVAASVALHFDVREHFTAFLKFAEYA